MWFLAFLIFTNACFMVHMWSTLDNVLCALRRMCILSYGMLSVHQLNHLRCHLRPMFFLFIFGLYDHPWCKWHVKLPYSYCVTVRFFMFLNIYLMYFRYICWSAYTFKLLCILLEMMFKYYVLFFFVSCNSFYFKCCFCLKWEVEKNKL